MADNQDVKCRCISDMCSLEGKVTERLLQGHNMTQKKKVSIVLVGIPQDFSPLCQDPVVEQPSFPNGLREWTGLVHKVMDICSDFSTPRKHETKNIAEFILIV